MKTTKIILTIAVMATATFAKAQTTENKGTSNAKIERTELSPENKPIIILDGVEISKDQMNQINSNDIEKVEVFKDQKAVNIFGEKARNGVIVITTKKNPVKSAEK